ncbi:MAG: hypothetical protein KDB07_05830 [Planctomycetes bacterium]|nr:hypothetical protein [Planctomycetota bacterium]
MSQGKRFFSMTFSQQLVNEPILHSISSKFGVEFNIVSANVSDSFGNLSLSLAGEDDKLQAALTYLRERGVDIEELPQPVNV